MSKKGRFLYSAVTNVLQKMLSIALSHNPPHPNVNLYNKCKIVLYVRFSFYLCPKINNNRRYMNADVEQAQRTKGFDNILTLGNYMYYVSSTQNPSCQQPFRTDFFIMGLCEEGECRIQINLHEHTFKKNDFIFIPPESLLQPPKSPDFGFKGKAILIAKEWFKDVILLKENLLPFFFRLAEHPYISLSNEDVKNLHCYFDIIRLKMQTEKDNKYIKNIMVGLLRSLFYDVYNKFSLSNANANKPKSRKEIVFLNFYKLLMENFKKERNVEFYAEQLFITPKHLSSTVKNVSGHSPSKWISSLVIQETKLQLQTTNRSMQEIANDLNFPNQSFFSKYFRHYTGQTPKEYRSSIVDE